MGEGDLLEAGDVHSLALLQRPHELAGLQKAVVSAGIEPCIPARHGRGEQVGIIFDGNYEGLGNDFFYNEEKGRSIAVDIRYVLFLTDKFGGAGYILKELDIKGASPAMLRAMGIKPPTNTNALAR